MTRLLVVIGFVIWFGAGLAVGWRVATPEAPPPHPSHGGGWLAQQLNLTADQQKQLDAIWQPLGGRGGPPNRDARAQLRREREAAIAALIPGDQKEAYQKIQDDYTTKMTALETQSKQLFLQAVEKTKAILTPQQRVKYDQLMAKFRREPEGHDRGHPPHDPQESPPLPPPPSHDAESPDTGKTPQTPQP